MLKGLKRWVRGESSRVKDHESLEVVERQARQIDNQNAYAEKISANIRGIVDLLNAQQANVPFDHKIEAKWPRQNPGMCGRKHRYVGSVWQRGGRGEVLCHPCGHIEGGDCHSDVDAPFITDACRVGNHGLCTSKACMCNEKK